jgi:hypothetical protein
VALATNIPVFLTASCNSKRRDFRPALSVSDGAHEPGLLFATEPGTQRDEPALFATDPLQILVFKKLPQQ